MCPLRAARECRHEAGLPVQARPTASELEMAWVFHSGIFYYGVRKYIYESPVLEDKEQMISDALEAYLAGFERVFGAAAAAARAAHSRSWVWHHPARNPPQNEFPAPVTSTTLEAGGCRRSRLRRFAIRAPAAPMRSTTMLAPAISS